MSLLRWLFTSKCPQCKQQLDKNSKHCRHCGADNPHSWRQCMKCGVSVAADSAVCWSCRADLLSQPRNVIFGDRWAREPGVFAMRVPIETPRERLRHGIQVDEGVRGALYRNGTFREELGSGYHTMSSFWERLTGGDQTGQNVEAIVANADTVICVITADETAGIMTAGFERVTFAGISLEVELDDLQRFQRRFLPFGTLEVAENVLLDGARTRVIESVRILVRGLTVERLSDAMDLRRRCEAALGQDLPRLLGNFGLRFCGVHDIILEGPALRERQSKEEEISNAARGAGWEKRLRDIRLSGELSKFKDEKGFQEQIDIWTTDYDLSALDRRHLVKMRAIEVERQRELAAAAARAEVEKLRTRSSIELESMEFENDMKELAALRAHQKEMLGFLDQRRARERDADLERDLRREQHATASEVTRADAFRDLKAETLPYVADSTRAEGVSRILAALRPQVIAMQPLPHYQVHPWTHFPPPAGSSVQPVSLETFVPTYLPCVGVVVVGLALGTVRSVEPQGTVWVARGMQGVLTNAHVAKAVAEACAQGAEAWVMFNGSPHPIPVKSISIHPEYGGLSSAGRAIPSWDAAVLELAGPLPGPGIPLAGPSTLRNLRELQTVAYLGFPMEGLAGGGVNLRRPCAIAKCGVLSALQDWTMGHTSDPSERMLLVHDLGVAGGASGSPLFDTTGNVIGIISAGNMELIPDPITKKLRRIPSAAHLNFAQRIDVFQGSSAVMKQIWRAG